MAKKSGLGNNLFISGYDLSGDVGTINNIGTTRGVQDVTSINKSAHERLLTHSDSTISFNSFFNDASLAEHDALSTLPTTDRIVSFLMGSTLGDSACALVGKQLNYNASRTADGGLTFSVDVVGQGFPLEWGISGTAGKVTHSSATNISSIDNSASTSNGASAYLQSFAVSSGTCIVKVQHSTNDSSWSDLITFTGATGITSERATSSGTVNRYLRVISSGTFSNCSFNVIIKRGTANDI
tara:strand:- start:3214 stop:3933 length:720 start_codon:yes stop_codon:yes gene_type:complete